MFCRMTDKVIEILGLIMKAILFDLDGVVYQGGKPIPGAVDTIRWCQLEKIPFLYVTNTTSKPRRHLVEKLQGLRLLDVLDADIYQVRCNRIA